MATSEKFSEEWVKTKCCDLLNLLVVLSFRKFAKQCIVVFMNAQFLKTLPFTIHIHLPYFTIEMFYILGTLDKKNIQHLYYYKIIFLVAGVGQFIIYTPGCGEIIHSGL